MTKLMLSLKMFLCLFQVTSSSNTNTNKDIHNADIGSTSTNASDEASKAFLPSFPLKPTVLLHPAHAHASRSNSNSNGNERKTQSTDESNTNTNTNSILHPHVSAVYVGLDYLSLDEEQEHTSGIHDNDSDSDNAINTKDQSFIREHNDNIRRFNEVRKFSRFEHASRINQAREQDKGALFRKLYDDDFDDDDADEVAKTMAGGSFDAFQSAPLSQGIGTHYATVWVGSPIPQPQTLIVDTGSHHTAFPCKPCNNCGGNYHANKFFDPHKSDSFQLLICGQCTKDINDTCHKTQQCRVSQSYAEGSSWSAIQAKDMFSCGYNHPHDLLVNEGYDVDKDVQLQHYDETKLSLQYSIPFIFGCQNHLSGLFISQLADGIMGMSATEYTLTNQLYIAKKIEHKMFSMCFARLPKQDKDGITAGILTIGGVDARLQRSPMVYAATKIVNGHGWFVVHVKKMWLRKGGGQSAKAMFVEGDAAAEPEYKLVTENESKLNSGDGVLVDSGTTDTYFPRALGSAFKDAWQEMTGMGYRNNPMKLTREQVLHMPTILVQMTAAHVEKSDESLDVDDVPGLAGKLSLESPHDIVLAIPATHYMEYSVKDDHYTPRVYWSESSGGTLGANAMMNHDVLFDWENMRLGIAESNCDYDELVEGVEVLLDETEDTATVDVSDGVSKDCVLGEVNVELSCIETVDTSSCNKVDQEHELAGITKITILVEEEGFGDGKTCVTAAKEKTILMDLRKNARTDCNDGFCTIKSICSMTCKDALGIDTAPETKPVTKTNNTGTDSDTNPGTDESNEHVKKACPDEGWGGCQHSCEQSKITAELRQDGECHVGKIESRSCHIDNCGRSDPCRVPFLVHAILLFAGVDASEWTKADEDFLVETFASAVNIDRESGDELFGPGDIKITSVNKWSADKDEFYSGDIKTGMKAVLEVSIYNEKTILPSQDKNGTKTVLDKGKDMIHVITGTEHTVCKDSDIYPLSKTALDVHVELGKAKFMRMVIQNMRDDDGRDFLGESVFAPLRDEGESVERSKVLTSWTIKSEVSGGFFNDGTFEGFNKGTGSNTLLFIGASFLFFGICYCGVFFGTFFTKRSFRMEQAKNALIKSIQEKRQHRDRGEYAQVDSNQGEVEMGNLESFDDHPIIEDIEELDFTR